MKGTVAEFVVLLRLHYTLENFVSVGQFARRIRDVFGEDQRFRYFFHHIARLGGPNDESITIVSEQEQKEIEACLMVETLRVQDADRIAAVLSTQFPAAMMGVYRLLCEIRSSDPM